MTKLGTAPYSTEMPLFIALVEAPRRARRAVLILAIVVLALLSGRGVRDASAAPPAPSKAARAVLADYADNNRFDTPHSCAAVDAAIAYMSLLTDAPMASAVRALRTYARQVCPAGDFVQIRGGSPAQRHLARLVALRVGGVTLREVRFQQPGAVLRHMHVRGAEVVVTSSQPGTVRGEWELHLYAGTLAALLARYRVRLGGISAGGREGPLRLWPGFDLYSQLPRAGQVAALVMGLVNASAQAGARVVEERTISTPARAIALTLQVSDPAAFLKHRALSILNVLYHTKVPLLGFYVGLQDASGRLVWATSRLPNEGAVYATPQLDACSPVKHSEMAGAQELPCPAK